MRLQVIYPSIHNFKKLPPFRKNESQILRRSRKILKGNLLYQLYNYVTNPPQYCDHIITYFQNSNGENVL